MKITTKLITRLSILGFLITFIGCTGELDVEPGDPNAFLAEDFYSDAQSYREGLVQMVLTIQI